MSFVTNCPSDCVIGEGCEIAPSAVLGKGCKIGNQVVIHSNVVLYDNTVIEDGVEIFENCVIGRPPKSAGNLIHKLKKEYGPVTIGKNTVVGAGVVIYAENQIANNVLLGDYACLRECCVLKEYCIVGRFATTNHHATIGHHARIVDYSHITAHTIVGDNVFIGVGVITTNGADMRLTGAEVGEKGAVIFENGCRVGSGAILLPGTIIGQNSLVGAGSVVTKDVAPDKTVMGIPAREKN